MPNTLLLVFRLQTAEYALPVSAVVEVLRMVAVSPLPGSPAWLSGVINLRGHVIPVMDLRVRLGLTAQPVDLTTPLIIVAANGQTLGLVVDSAVEVLSVAPDCIEAPTPRAGDTSALAGIVRFGARLIIILEPQILMPGLPLLPTTSEPTFA